MSQYEELKLELIDEGKTKEIIDNHIRRLGKELNALSNKYDIPAENLKGSVEIKIELQAVKDVEDHFVITTEISKKLPKIKSTGFAVHEDGEILVKKSGSNKLSPNQGSIMDIEGVG